MVQVPLRREGMGGGIGGAGRRYGAVGVAQHQAVAPRQDSLDPEPGQRGLQVGQERDPGPGLGRRQDRSLGGAAAGAGGGMVLISGLLSGRGLCAWRWRPGCSACPRGV